LSFSATDAVSREPFSDQLSLFARPNGISKLWHVGYEGRHGNGVALPPFVTDVAKFRDLFRTRDQRKLVA
jgi:hypothetical protein